MEQGISWFKEQMENKKFRVYMVFACVCMLGLGIEFFFLQYSLPKAVRYLILMAGLFVIAWIDRKSKRIPNKILIVLLGARALVLILEWIIFSELGLSLLISTAMGALFGGGMFLLCYVISRGGVGAGDVKLFAVIGCFMGSSTVLTAAFLTVVTAAVYSVIMLIRKKTSLKEEIPFAPFILTGVLLTMALGM